MKFKTFAAFVGPSVFMMLLFIALTLITLFTDAARAPPNRWGPLS